MSKQPTTHRLAYAKRGPNLRFSDKDGPIIKGALRFGMRPVEISAKTKARLLASPQFLFRFDQGFFMLDGEFSDKVKPSQRRPDQGAKLPKAYVLGNPDPSPAVDPDLAADAGDDPQGELNRESPVTAELANAGGDFTEIHHARAKRAIALETDPNVLMTWLDKEHRASVVNALNHRLGELDGNPAQPEDTSANDGTAQAAGA